MPPKNTGKAKATGAGAGAGAGKDTGAGAGKDNGAGAGKDNGAGAGKDNGKEKAAYERVQLIASGMLGGAANVEKFHAYMQQHNNTFTNDQGQSVVFTRAVVVDPLHESTSLGDPSKRARYGITLTNDELQKKDGTTHLLHFRPDFLSENYFYKKGYTLTEAKQQQEKRKGRRDAKKNNAGGGGAAGQGGRGGGAASGTGSASGTQPQQQGGRGSATQPQRQGGQASGTQPQQQGGRGSGSTAKGRGSGTAGRGRGG